LKLFLTILTPYAEPVEETSNPKVQAGPLVLTVANPFRLTDLFAMYVLFYSLRFVSAIPPKLFFPGLL